MNPGLLSIKLNYPKKMIVKNKLHLTVELFRNSRNLYLKATGNYDKSKKDIQ